MIPTCQSFLINYLISAGVGKNSYIDDLLEFAGCFVDSKKRQLRFSAFAAANKMCENAPRSKVVVIKRAYRKKPLHGFCPSPESHWGDVGWERLQKLEELLRFLHVTCKPHFDKMTPQLRNKLVTNIDIAAADAFFATTSTVAATATALSAPKSSKQRVSVKVVEDSLLGATQRFLEPLGIKELPGAQPDYNWIDFEKFAAKSKASQNPKSDEGSTASASTAVAVISFDEADGAMLNAQLEFPEEAEAKKTEEAIELPWRTWWCNQNDSLGAKEADMSSAVAVLQMVHESFDMRAQEIDVIYSEVKGVRVVTTSKVPACGILLPPCVPK